MILMQLIWRFENVSGQRVYFVQTFIKICLLKFFFFFNEGLFISHLKCELVFEDWKIYFSAVLDFWPSATYAFDVRLYFLKTTAAMTLLVFNYFYTLLSSKMSSVNHVQHHSSELFFVMFRVLVLFFNFINQVVN